MEQKNRMKNKRGDIPVMVLVIGVFCVCTLTLISFTIFDLQNSGGVYEIRLVGHVSFDWEEFNFYIKNGMDVNLAAKKIYSTFNGDILTIERKNYISYEEGTYSALVKYTKILDD